MTFNMMPIHERVYKSWPRKFWYERRIPLKKIHISYGSVGGTYLIPLFITQFKLMQLSYSKKEDAYYFNLENASQYWCLCHEWTME